MDHSLSLGKISKMYDKIMIMVTVKVPLAFFQNVENGVYLQIPCSDKTKKPTLLKA